MSVNPVAAIGSLFGGGGGKNQPPTGNAFPDEAETDEERRKRMLAERRRRGRAQTILSGGSGVTGDAPVSARPTLLGG